MSSKKAMLLLLLVLTNNFIKSSENNCEKYAAPGVGSLFCIGGTAACCEVPAQTTFVSQCCCCSLGTFNCLIAATLCGLFCYDNKEEIKNKLPDFAKKILDKTTITQQPKKEN